MLTYSMRSPEDTLFIPKPHPLLENALVYNPPTPEFTVVKVTISGRVSLPPVGGASIIIIIRGEGVVHCNGEEMRYHKGSVYFISANNNILINNDDDDNTLLFQAY
uniref:Mannose-6-phosphate isomerase cupin domain-containing protein n=1 Tax=Amphimedon queenslandica TaxID=400682 RepID=A0A1X7SEG1_AMPQE